MRARGMIFLRIAAFAVAAFAVGAGCGKPVLRVADASLGDYYTEKEYQKLSEEQRQEYCGELADQLDSYRAQIADAEEALAALRRENAPMEGKTDSLRALETRLAERLAAERTRAPSPGGGDARASRHVVKPGDSLWKISGDRAVYGRGASWERLYGANRGLIRDPNLIYPGQEITIPR